MDFLLLLDFANLSAIDEGGHRTHRCRCGHAEAVGGVRPQLDLDLGYVPVQCSWLYLTAVIDLYNLIGRHCSRSTAGYQVAPMMGSNIIRYPESTRNRFEYPESGDLGRIAPCHCSP